MGTWRHSFRSLDPVQNDLTLGRILFPAYAAAMGLLRGSFRRDPAVKEKAVDRADRIPATPNTFPLAPDWPVLHPCLARSRVPASRVRRCVLPSRSVHR